MKNIPQTNDTAYNKTKTQNTPRLPLVKKIIDLCYQRVSTRENTLYRIVCDLIETKAPTWDAWEKAHTDTQALVAEIQSDSTRFAHTPHRFEWHKEKKLSLIAECKQRSPSAGTIVDSYNPAEFAKLYRRLGARGISVLTEEKYFGGTLSDLRDVRKAVSLPILRKDFIVHPKQVVDAYAYGADYILLIMKILDDQHYRMLYDTARNVGLHVLTEVHTRHELTRAVELGAHLIGINNRDLSTLKIDLRTSEYLRAHIPATMHCISESGIQSIADLNFIKQLAFNGVLIGHGLLENISNEDYLREFFSH